MIDGGAAAQLATRLAAPAQATEITINSWSLEFSEEAGEKEFRAVQSRLTTTLARQAITAGSPGYLLLTLILDDPDARRFAVIMSGLLLIWMFFIRWDGYQRHYDLYTTIGIASTTSASMFLLYALPPEGSMIIMIAFGTLNFIWTFVFLRPRFPWGLAIGIGYASVMTTGGAVIWDRFGEGAPPEGFVEQLGGTGGGLIIVTLYVGFLLVLCATVGYRFEKSDRVDFLLRRQLDAEHRRSEGLLLNILPEPIAARLKAGEHPIADHLESVTVVFIDLVGFTPLSSQLGPHQTVALLDELFSRFDDLTEEHGLEKIKTIGDAYMAIAYGTESPSAAATSAADLSLAIRDGSPTWNLPSESEIGLRIGIASGPAVAGVIGQRTFSYDLWGDTVNVASRMESHAPNGCIQIDARTHDILTGRFEFEDRGQVEVKGKGAMPTWLLLSRSNREFLVPQGVIDDSK